MKKLLATLALTTALSLPSIAQARQVNINTRISNFGGSGVYLAMYITDSAGQYRGTLWMAGSRSSYYTHLRDWMRLSHGAFGDIHGITGASLTSGQDLRLSANLADALFDAGYKLHIDVAVEDWGDGPSDLVVPLSTKDAGKTFHGRRYIGAFSYKM